MHVFEIVLEDDGEGFFEDEHPRYLFLYEPLLTATAIKLGVASIKSFDGFSEAETIANEKAAPDDTIGWLSAYNDARDKLEPVWYDPAAAINPVLEVKKAIEAELASNPDDDIEYLVEALEILAEILQAAQNRNSKFFMALM